MNVDNLDEKEKHLIELARKGWNVTIKDFYFPPLDEPKYIFDYTHLEGFYIDPENKWTITMNLANVPIFLQDQQYIDYFYAVTLHEVSHYQIIPYDGLINAKLLKASMKHLSQHIAPVIVNLFADLVIDKKLFKRYPILIEWEIKSTFNNVFNKYKERLSNFSKFLCRCYEKLLGVEILENTSSDNLNLLANKVVKIVNKSFEDASKWEEKVSKISYILKKLIIDTFNVQGINSKLSKGEVSIKVKDPQEVNVTFPEDILELVQNPLENKNIDKLKKDNEEDLRNKAESFAKNTPFSEFGAPANQAGLLLDDPPLATWYRGLSKELIEIKIKIKKPGGALPIYPEVWRIGDPIENLDVLQSLLISPVLIPNITTRKWIRKEGKWNYIEQELPDLLLVLDSSGSMNWKYRDRRNRGKYHTALLASFAALYIAAKKGVKFSVINFSNRADVCDWTFDYRKAEQVLLRYQGGGTELPTKALVNQCQKSERPTLIFIITDFGINNWSTSKNTFINLIEHGHKIIGFFIGSNEIPQNKFKELIPKMKFYPILKPSSLIDLIIEEIKNFYF